MSESYVWFVASDVCAILDIKNTSDALKRLCDDEKGIVSTDTHGGPQHVSAVNESGLYTLIFSSRKASAERFRKWVTHEVLPSIRKTGSYSITKDFSGGFMVPRTFADALRLAADQADKIEIMKPKAEFYDIAMSTDAWFDMQQVATIIAMKGFGRNNLFSLLISKHVFINSNTPYRDQIEAGRFKVIEMPYEISEGKKRMGRKIVVSQKGIDFIIKLITGKPLIAGGEINESRAG